MALTGASSALEARRKLSAAPPGSSSLEQVSSKSLAPRRGAWKTVNAQGSCLFYGLATHYSKGAVTWLYVSMQDVERVALSQCSQHGLHDMLHLLQQTVS